MFLFRSLHNVSVSDNAVVRKEIPNDFGTFMNEYIRFARQNDTTKRYSVHDMQTQVVNCIANIVTASLKPDCDSSDVAEAVQALADSIADKLLRAERQAQEKIEQMRTYIKKGSLVQSLISTETDGEYLFIVAKVEHSEWFHGESLQKNLGFPGDKKNVWKSAVFSISAGDPLLFNSIRVYVDNNAKYWPMQFLELDEEQTNDYNTRIAFDSIQAELRRHVRPVSERDYYILRNTLIQTMKTPQQINYPDLVQKLVGNYVPEAPNLNLDKVRSSLSDLPEKKRFDRQFVSVPERIVERRHNFFPLTQGVDLSIKGAVEDFKETIIAEENVVGTRYIRVLCSDSKTYEIFKPKVTSV